MRKAITTVAKGLILCSALAMFVPWAGTKDVMTVNAQGEDLSEYASLTVGDVEMVKDGEITGEAPQGASFDASTATLTLSNFQYSTTKTGYYSVIDATGIENLTIVLEGTNRFNVAPDEKSTITGIFTQGELEITGDGTLDMYFEGAETRTSITGIHTVGDDTDVIDAGKISITANGEKWGTLYGISTNPWRSQDLEIRGDFSFTTTGHAYDIYGVDVQKGNLLIENAKIEMNFDEVTETTYIGAGLIDMYTDYGYDSGVGYEGGTVTLDHATLDFHTRDNWGSKKVFMYFFDFQDLSDSIYYVGNGQPEAKVNLEDIASYIRYYDKNGHEAIRTEVKFSDIRIGQTSVDAELMFEDVNKGDWYYDYVENAYVHKIMTGKNSAIFAPTTNLVRAEFARVLYNFDLNAEAEGESPFPDVTEDDWFEYYVIWAAEAGIVTGYQNGYFGPADYVTREQIATMLLRYAKSRGFDVDEAADFSDYVDANLVSDFAEEAMQWAVGSGIITGKDNETKLDPQGLASRAECATMMMRFSNKYITWQERTRDINVSR